MKRPHYLKAESFLARIPINWYFFLFIGSLAVCLNWLKDVLQHKDNIVEDIVKILCSFAAIAIAILLVLGFISTLFAWIVFRQKSKSNMVQTILEVPADQSQRSQQSLHIKINPILCPLLGFIKIRFEDKDEEISDKYRISSNTLLNTSTL